MTSAAIFNKSMRACTSNRFTVSATGTWENNTHADAMAAQKKGPFVLTTLVNGKIRFERFSAALLVVGVLEPPGR
jgi:hypothetical protein